MARLIKAAHDTYFDPELFRLNLNNAIQTSRTVTFVLQKHKDSIPGYQKLYLEPVAAFKDDPLMKWLVDARNAIEKEGDLATYSEMRAKIIHSYLDEGPSIDAREEGLLFAGTRKLQKWWSTRVPAWAVETSAIAVERRWVANSLPGHELTDVLIHGYQRLLAVARAVDAATGHEARPAIDVPVSHLGSSMRRSFIKLSDGVEYTLGERPLPAVTKALREKVKARYGAFHGRFLFLGKTLPERIEAWADLAAEVFNRDGYHQTMYVLLGADGNILKVGSVAFADRVDKFLFWNQMGEFARSDRDVCGVVLVGEAWARQQDINAFDGNIDAVPIVGEILVVEGTNDQGEVHELTFDIVKTSGRPQVDRSKPLPPRGGDHTLFDPLRRAWRARNTS